MSRRVLTHLDLTGFALIGAMLDPRTSDPSGLGTSDAGRTWTRTDTGRPMLWTGTAAVDLLDLGAATGTLLASKISDFTSAVQAIPWGSLANPTADVNAGGRKITNVADGVAGSDVPSYGQVLALINNQVFKAPVRVASTANLTLSGTQTVDGVALSAGDRVLVKDQTTGANNGIYVVAAGAWTRATDADSSAELAPGSIVPVTEGSTLPQGASQPDRLYILITNGPITLGTTSLTFMAYGASAGEVGVAGAGLTKTGVTYDVGAGTGISVAADSVAVDTSVVVRKVQGTIPTSTTGIYSVSGAAVTVNHGFGNPCPRVTVRYGSAGASPGALVEVDDSAGDSNNVTVTFPSAPATNQYVIMVEG